MNLQVSALGFQPVLDVALGISGEAEHEVPLDLQLVDGLDGLMDLKSNRWHLKEALLRSVSEGESSGRKCKRTLLIEKDL